MALLGFIFPPHYVKTSDTILWRLLHRCPDAWLSEPCVSKTTTKWAATRLTESSSFPVHRACVRMSVVCGHLCPRCVCPCPHINIAYLSFSKKQKTKKRWRIRLRAPPSKHIYFPFISFRPTPRVMQKLSFAFSLCLDEFSSQMVFGSTCTFRDIGLVLTWDAYQWG